MNHSPLLRAGLVALGVAALVAVLGPVVSYRNDLTQLRRQFRTQVEQLGQFHSAVLKQRVELLTAELGRIAARPEIDPSDGAIQIEIDLLDFATARSMLFPLGVALTDAAGTVVWSEPANLGEKLGTGLSHRAWFTRTLAERAPAIDVLEPESETFVVSAPVLRNGAVKGVAFALLDADTIGLPNLPMGLSLSVFDESGDWLVGPSEAVALDREALSDLERQGVHEWRDGERLVTTRDIGHTGLTLAVVGNVEDATAALRSRFRTQLLTVGSLQLAATLLLALLLAATWRRHLALESRAEHESRLLALGSAASLIAHELKNGLNGMKAAATLLSSGGSSDSELGLSTLNGQADRLAHLGRTLLSFARPETPSPRAVKAVDVVRRALESATSIPEAEEARVSTDLDESLTLRVDAALLDAALDNLVRNAIEAAVAAKDLGRQPAPAVDVRLRREENRIRFEVEDNGGGLDPLLASRLFDPFVTGKSKGVGLGLALARRAAETQGGTLHHEPGIAGARFVLQLPDDFSGSPS